MRFLNGFKTLVGAIGVALSVLSKAEIVVLFPEVAQPYILGASAMLAALGVVHKVEKHREEKRQDQLRYPR